MWPVGLDIQPEMPRDTREVVRFDEVLEQSCNSYYASYCIYIHHNRFTCILSQKIRLKISRLSCFLVSMYLARKYLVRTLFLRPLLETGPPFYPVI